MKAITCVALTFTLLGPGITFAGGGANGQGISVSQAAAEISSLLGAVSDHGLLWQGDGNAVCVLQNTLANAPNLDAPNYLSLVSTEDSFDGAYFAATDARQVQKTPLGNNGVQYAAQYNTTSEGGDKIYNSTLQISDTDNGVLVSIETNQNRPVSCVFRNR